MITDRQDDRVGPPAPLVLIVEDDIDAARVATDFLAVLGMRSETASDALEALTWLSENRPDMILLDICLPGMDGVDIVRVLRRVEHLQDVPIVAASGVYTRGSGQLRELGRLGISSFLSKPFSLSGLRSAISAAVPDLVGHPNDARGARSVPGRLDVQGRQQSVRLLSAGSRQLVLVGDGAGPVGGTILPVEFNADSGHLTVLARVLNVVVDGGGWRAELQVEASRPSDAFDRVASLLN